VFEVISAMLGKANVSNYSLSDLTDARGYHRAELPGHLVNFASEINTRVGIDKFKALVSGEPIDARHPYGTPFTIEDYAKFIFSANELPADVEQSHAFFRRFLILPFEKTIPDQQQDKHLPQRIIHNELPGVLNWALEALPRLRQQAGFSECEAAAHTLQRFQVESDSVQVWLEEAAITAGEDERENITSIYAKYREGARDAGMMPVKRNKFKKRLEALGFTVERMRTGTMVKYQIADGDGEG
jgi:putative DNA primase/helicase